MTYQDGSKFLEEYGKKFEEADVLFKDVASLDLTTLY